MRLKFFIIPAALMFQVAGAQNGPAPLANAQTTAATVATASSTPLIAVPQAASTASPESAEVSIMDYKSVYEAPSLEEEVQMAAERFRLTQSQQEIWYNAAKDRRQTEKKVYARLESKAPDLSRDAEYKELRNSHNAFYETIIGFLNPSQKQALEFDRAVMAEKQKRIAKLPPPPPPAPTVTVAPVDSAAIKEAEKAKAPGKKSKKKKKPAGA
jgi:hypothetical protein